MNRSALAMLVISLGLASGVRAQPTEPPPKDAVDPARVRARFERRLEEVRALEKRLSDALARLDQGADADEVMRDVPMRDLWGREQDPEGRGNPEWRGDRDRGGDRGGERDRGRPEPPDREGPPRASPEEVQRFIDEFAPRLAERINRVRAESPTMADRLLERMRPRVGELLQTQRDDPSFFEVRRDDFLASIMMIEAGRELGEARRSGDEAKISAARDQARGAIAQSVDARRRVQEAELARLERRLQSLRDEIAQDAQRRDAIIDERLADLESHSERIPDRGTPIRRDRSPR